MSDRGGLRAAILALTAGFVLLSAFPVAAQAETVLVTEVRGPITPVIAGHLQDAVAAAANGNHAALIVELDTPGGLVSSMREIVQTFLTAPVPVVVHVSPPGSSAASAGAVMTFAAHVAAMAPGTNIGAATPIDLEGGEVIDKVIEDAVAYVTAIAELRGRDVDFVVDTVREGRSASSSEAAEIGAVDLVVRDLGDLLAEIDGTEVTIDPGERTVTLSTADAQVVRYQMSAARRVLQTLADPNLAFLFLSLGTLAILYELANPGAGFGGIIGAIMLILAFFSLAVLPTDLVGIALLLLAAALFTAELFAPGIGVFAGGGTIALLLAGLFLFQRPTGIGIDLSVLLPVVVVVGIGAVLVGRVAWRSQRSPAYSGQGASLVGERGVVRDVTGDVAQVFVAGALWRARARDHPLEPGAVVRVTGMEGLRLEVEREHAEGVGTERPDEDDTS